MVKMTVFQKKVIQAVCSIPFGQTRSYKWVAQKAGYPRAVRAVGSALKKNRNLFIIPCHRVVKANGELGRYSLGKDIKQLILDVEKTMRRKNARRIA
ncbi:MAG: MGMT family protein [Candidatus Omnitrophota bacterium]